MTIRCLSTAVTILVCTSLIGLWLPRRAEALELCSAESRALMRKASISETKIVKVCALARQADAVLAISIMRREDALGYCLVTLALHNNSIKYLNQLALVSSDGRFEIFRFDNVQPGARGYASAKSRILLECDELEETGGITFHWPASIRIGDRHPVGARLNSRKPKFLMELLCSALGYCLVTLALHNNSIKYLNQLALVSSDGRFEIFRFDNVQPGARGYASAKSRILLECDELEETGGITFHWPASIRIGDRHPVGARLNSLKPKFLDKTIRWSR